MQPHAGARMREGVLRTLGSLCMSRDEVRRQLIEAKVGVCLGMQVYVCVCVCRRTSVCVLKLDA